MEYFVTFFQTHQLVALFLTVGLGFWLGQKRIKGFAMGAVAATLIVGVIVGQMRIVIPDMVKNIFFLFFLFSLGYGVGPQFFRSFRGPGTKMVLFAVLEALICAGTIYAAARIMGYNNGIATGLFAGSQTASACLGMVSDTVRGLGIDEDRRDYLLMIIPACYAVTYVFGTIGSAWFLSAFAPRFFGGLDAVRTQCAELEESMNGDKDVVSPGDIRAGRPVLFRCLKADSDLFANPVTVSQLEHTMATKGCRIVVERIGRDGKILEAKLKTEILKGDRLVIAGRQEVVIAHEDLIGPEIVDPELLNFSARKTPVTVSHHGASGKSVGELRKEEWMEY